MKLNLGANDDHKQGYVSVDICLPADVVCDLSGAPWPWPDSSVDEIYAHDVFEHLPNIIQTMNEAHRILKPGGILDLAVPSVCLTDGRVNPGGWCDPTHRSFWHPDVRYYFGEEWLKEERGRFGAAYGITALFRGLWLLQDYGAAHERRSKILARLEACK